MNLHKARIVGLKDAARSLMLRLQVAMDTYPIDQTGVNWNFKGKDQPRVIRFKQDRNSAETEEIFDRGPDGEPIKGPIKTEPNPYRAICSILECHVKNLRFKTRDIAALKRSLSSEVFELRFYERKGRGLWCDARGIVSGPGLPIRYLKMVTLKERIVAEDLLRFLESFTASPTLPFYHPIGFCPVCEGLFLKKKPRQECCSSKCYSQKWSQEKVKQEPRYFADKAAQSRAVKKAQKAARVSSKQKRVKGAGKRPTGKASV